MNSRFHRLETILSILAILLALGLRFTRLGELPLTDAEARLALDALHISQGQSPALGSHIAYTNLTAVLFFVFGSFNFLARFWPALAGTALVLVPLLLRDRTGSRSALILAFFFAIDPAFVALSRQAGSPILAVTTSLLAAGFWIRRQQRLAGICLALALLSGPALWAGIVALLLTWLLTQFLSTKPVQAESESVTEASCSEAQDTGTRQALRPTPYLPLITAFVLTLLSVSTLFLLAPQGLSAWLGALPEYLAGWVAPVSFPASLILLALGVYQLLGILLALASVVRGGWRGDRLAIHLSLWMLVAIILAVLAPSHQPADLAWALVPLWTLAAFELARHLDLDPGSRLETMGVAIATAILLIFAWLDFGTLGFVEFPSQEGTVRLILFVAVLLFLLAGVTLVGLGWSERVARVGAVWGSVSILGIYTLGAAWGATGLRDPKAVEFWDMSPRPAQADLLLQTVDETSEWATGQANDLPVAISGVDSPALLWVLRNHDPETVLGVDQSAAPALIVTSLQGDPALAATYRGQDFIWRRIPVWSSFPFIRWLTAREMPASAETIILWAHPDFFISAKPSQP